MLKPTRVRGRTDGTFDVITIDDEIIVGNYASIDSAIAASQVVTTKQVQDLESA